MEMLGSQHVSRVQSVCLLALVALFPYATSETSNYTLEVCPNALWKDAIILKGPSSPDTFANVTKWTSEQFKTYVTETIFPQVRPNVIFVVIPLIILLVFLLWRLFRRCCMCCCMRQSCDISRHKAEPRKVLSGCGYWFKKVILFLFALAALGMLLAGIIMAPKELFSKVWTPIDSLTRYLNDTTTRMDDLVAGLSGVNPILNNLTWIVNNDVNLPYIRARLQDVNTTLSSSASDPTTVATTIGALDLGMTSVKNQVAAVRPQLASSGLPANISTLQAGLPGLSAAVATCTDYSSLLGQLILQLQTLSTTSNTPYDATPLESAMSAVEPVTWTQSLATMTSSLDVWRSFRSNNTLSVLATDLTALSTSVDSLKNVLIPNASNALTSFYNSWISVNASLSGLLDRITYVQANVAELDASSTTAVNRLRSVQSNLSALNALPLRPDALAADLNTLAGGLNLGALSTFVTTLNAAQTNLNTVPLAILDDARNALGNLRASLESLSPKYASTKSAIATYKISSMTLTDLNTLKSSAVVTNHTFDLSGNAKANADIAIGNNSVTVVQDAASNSTLTTSFSTISTDSATADDSLATANASISSRPSLAPYQVLINSLKSLYDSMPTPKTKELSPVFSTLNTLESLLTSVPNTVRTQTASVQTSFGEGVDQLEKKVINKSVNIQDDNRDQVHNIDVIRYRATCGLLGLAAFFVVLMLVVAAINCPWGIGCAIVFLLVMAALLFVLAVIFAVVLVVAQDGCHHSERIVLDALGPKSSITPLVDFYFFADNNASVKAALKKADLVDIDRVMQDVVGLADNIISNFTAQFKPRRNLSVTLADMKTFINVTFDKVNLILDQASVRKVRPLYEDLKSYPCCDVPGYAAELWIILTFGAWLMMMTANFAMALLGLLDQLPQSGCCGCKPLIGKRLAEIKPEVEAPNSDDKVLKAVVVPPVQHPSPSAPPMPQEQGNAPYPYPYPATGYPLPPADNTNNNK